MYFFSYNIHTNCIQRIIILSETIHTLTHARYYYTEIVNEFLVVLNDISKTRNMRVNTIYTYTHILYIIHVHI
jgi:hypothetical protein